MDEDQFEDGFGFDASSIRGWAAIHESDMLLVPDADALLDGSVCRTANALLDRQRRRSDYQRGLCLRSAFGRRQRAESYLKFTGLADTAYFGPEAEFFVFDSVKFHNEQHSAGYTIDSDEAHWNSGRDANEFPGSNLGYRIRPKEGYVPVPPTRLAQRSAIGNLADAGEVWHQLSNVIITKSLPPVSAKSIFAIRRCWARPTIFKSSNT